MSPKKESFFFWWQHLDSEVGRPDRTDVYRTFAELLLPIKHEALGRRERTRGIWNLYFFRMHSKPMHDECSWQNAL